MLKRITALLLAVMMILLTACGAKEYDLSAVFAAEEAERATPITRLCGRSWGFPARWSRRGSLPP